MLNAAKSHWYVLTSKPREEQRAYDNLTTQGYDVFFPKIAKVKKTVIKTIAIDTPPILAVTDASIIGHHADTSFMLARFEQSNLK
jgi:hypothetical protein